jgi:hypothetical protein
MSLAQATVLILLLVIAGLIYLLNDSHKRNEP